MECSLKEGKVSQEWKIPNVVPIFNKVNKESPMNYRSVSMAIVVTKLCKNVLKDRHMAYLEDNGILSSRQTGFRNGG